MDLEDENAPSRFELALARSGRDDWARLAERLAWHLADCQHVLTLKGIGLPESHGDDGTKALEDFRRMIPPSLTTPRDYADEKIRSTNAELRQSRLEPI